ncbi:MAG: hypothetical protein WCC60_20135 [Ilumatobacteraceae bacterium]
MTISTTPKQPKSKSGNAEPVGHLPTITPEDIDRVNLRQALRDFELANARVVDLAARLSAMHQQMLDLQHRYTLTNVQLAAAERQFEQLIFERDVAREEAQLLRTSRSYRAGNMLVRVARRIAR